MKKITPIIMVTAMGILIIASALLIPKMTRTETTENIAIPVSSAKDNRQDALKIVGNWTITTSNQDTTEVSTYKINNDVTAVTINPLYKAAIIFLDLPSLTKNVPMIDVNIQAPPIDKG